MLKLSVVIPLYNQAHLIERCVKSVESQGFSEEELEVIIINDGSTDNAIEVVVGLQRQYSNIRLINQENRGLSGARNRGLDEAKGKYIYFIDSDDELRHGYLFHFVNALEKSTADLFVFNFEKVSDISQVNTSLCFDISPKYIEPKDLPIACQYVCWVHIFNLEFLRKSKIRFDEQIRLNEDTIFMIPFLYSSRVMVLFADIPAYLYIYNPVSIINNTNTEVVKKKKLESFKMVKALCDLRKTLSLSENISEFMKSTMIFCSRDYVDALFMCYLDMPLKSKLNDIRWLKSNGLYPSVRKCGSIKLRLFEFLKNHILTFAVVTSVITLFKRK